MKDTNAKITTSAQLKDAIKTHETEHMMIGKTAQKLNKLNLLPKDWQNPPKELSSTKKSVPLKKM